MSHNDLIRGIAAALAERPNATAGKARLAEQEGFHHGERSVARDIAAYFESVVADSDELATKPQTAVASELPEPDEPAVADELDKPDLLPSQRLTAKIKGQHGGRIPFSRWSA